MYNIGGWVGVYKNWFLLSCCLLQFAAHRNHHSITFVLSNHLQGEGDCRPYITAALFPTLPNKQPSVSSPVSWEILKPDPDPTDT